MKLIHIVQKGEKNEYNIKTTKMDTKILLILLWVFYTVNFMYCDTLSSLEPGVLEMHISGFTGMEQ